MKRIISLLLIVVLCLGTLASCGVIDTVTGFFGDEEGVAKAAIMLHNIYKNKGEATSSDFDVVKQVVVDGKEFPVTWECDNDKIKIVDSVKAGYYTVDLPDVNPEEFTYTLTATVSDGIKYSEQRSYTFKMLAVNNASVVTELEEGVSYKIAFTQLNFGQKMYVLNTTQGGDNKFINTDVDPKNGAEFFVEKADGGYKWYTLIDGVKNYVYAQAISADGKISKYIGFSAENSSVFVYNTDMGGVWTVTIDGNVYGVGTYGTYKTLCLSEGKHYTVSSVGSTQFVAQFYTTEYANSLAPDAEKEQVKEPAANSTLTIPEALELGAAVLDYTTNKYYISGTISSIASATYGNMYLKDEAGNEIYVYGTYDKTGDNRYDAMANAPQVGDVVVVYGVVGKYNGTPQMKNVWIQSINGVELEGNTPGGDVNPPVSADALTSDKVFANVPVEESGSFPSYADYNGDYTCNGFNITTVDVLRNSHGVPYVFQFKKSTGALTVSNVTVNSVTIVLVTSYETFSTPVVTLGGTELTIDSSAVMATKESTGTQNSSSFDVYRYTITITLDAATTGDLVIKNTSGYAMYLESIAIDGTSSGAPVDPNPETPVDPKPETPVLGVVDPVAGTAYKFGMVQGKLNDGKVYYLKGGMDGYYLATTTDVNAAIDVYLEETTGGYYLYTLVDGVKTYINMVVSADGAHVNGAYEAAATTVYTYNTESKTIIAVVNDADYWFGTRNDKTYTTVGPCAVSYAGFYCQFYGASEGGSDTPVDPQPPVHEHNFVEGKCECGETDPNYVPPTVDPDPTPNPTPDSSEIVFDFGANGDAAHADGTEIAEGTITFTSGNYSLILTDVSKVYSGAFDAMGNSAIKFGTSSLAGTMTFVVPNEVTSVIIYAAQYKSYADNNLIEINGVQYTLNSGSNQGAYDAITIDTTTVKTITVASAKTTGKARCMINTIVWVIGEGGSDTPVEPETPVDPPVHEHNFVEGKCECGESDPNYVAPNPPAPEKTVISIPEALAIAKAQGDTYTTEKYYITGIVTNISNTFYGNFYLVDAEGNELYVYGLKDSTGAGNFSGLNPQPAVGDTLTIYTVLGCYQGAPQAKDAWFESLVQHTEHTWADATCKVAKTCTICGKVEGEPLEHVYVDGACTGCGKSAPVQGTVITSTEPFAGLTASGQYNAVTTTSGWTAVNAAVLTGGTTDSNPVFKFIGDTADTVAIAINGKTTAVGKITSATLKNGISKLSFSYGNAFSESKGVDVTINILQNGEVVATTRLDNDSVTQKTAYQFTWELDKVVEGDFVIEIVNNSPTNSSSNNKDRIAIFNLSWDSAPVVEG